jgi:hypothetical protein
MTRFKVTEATGATIKGVFTSGAVGATISGGAGPVGTGFTGGVGRLGVVGVDG